MGREEHHGKEQDETRARHECVRASGQEECPTPAAIMWFRAAVRPEK